MYLQKVVSKKTLKFFFVQWYGSTDPDPDLRIRTKMSLFHNTAFSPQLSAFYTLKTDCMCFFSIIFPLPYICTVRYLTIVNCHVLNKTSHILLLAVFSGVRVGRGGSTSRTGTSGIYSPLIYCVKITARTLQKGLD
jgi:hypothetical protein